MTLPWMPSMPIVIAAPGGEGAVYSDVQTTYSSGWNNYTARTIYPIGSLIVPPNAPTKIRARLSVHSSSPENYALNAAYIGHQAASGDLYDFAATPTQLLFSGSATVTIPSGSSVWSDWMSFVWDRTSGLIFSAYGNNSSADNVGIISYGSAVVRGYFKSGNDAATVNASSYTAGGGTSFLSYLVDSIETDGF